MPLNDAIFRHGEPVMVDYTPTAGDVPAGAVVLVGNTTGWTCGIAHVPIANNVQGAIACFGGVYDMINLNNAATGAKVWWDATNFKATTTSTNNALAGFVVANGGGGANTSCRVFHHPNV